MLNSKNMAFFKEFADLSDAKLLQFLNQKSDQELIDFFRTLIKINHQYQEELMLLQHDNQVLKAYVQEMQSVILDYLD